MHIQIKDKVIHLVDITNSSPNLRNSTLIKWKVVPTFYSSRDKNFGGSTRSHIIPTPSNIRGLLMSVLGLKRKEVNYFLENYKVKVGLWVDLSNTYKITVTSNFIKNLESNDWFTRTQVSREVIYLKNRPLEIYFLVENKNQDLIKKLVNKEFTFTPYLGLSNFLFSIEEVEIISNFKVVENLENIIENKKIHIEIIPTKLKKVSGKEVLVTEYYYIFN